MTGNSCLIDTNIIVDSLRNKELASQLTSMTNLYISTIVYGELLFDAYNSQNPQKHIERLNLFLTNFTTLATDSNTAEAYAKIKANLRKKGTPIPDNDMWIAACAMQYALPLYTRDRDFKYIDGILLF
jgi:tRNA(fMet)-specific endonuclease VapC